MICTICGEEFEELHEMSDGEMVCDTCRDDGYFLCTGCNEWHPNNELELDDRYGHKICSDCADEYITCADCGEVIHEDNAIYIENYGCICDDCLGGSNYYRCDDCGNYFRRCDIRYIDGDFAICEQCGYDWFQCRECGSVCHIDDMYGDGYCENCYEEDSGLHDYGYKPSPHFYGSGTNLYMGVELEIDKGDDVDDTAEWIERNNEEMYCKEDGSLSDDGIEIVTHPATLDYHMNDMCWKDLCDEVVSRGYRSHDTTTCGLHVHVSRDFFGDTNVERDLNVAKLVLLVNRFFESHIVPFSRRGSYELGRWAKKNIYTEILPEDTEEIVVSKVNESRQNGRYQAINLQNCNTVEFRMFRGTLKYSTLIATLQFVDTICRFAKNVQLNDIDSTQWGDIFAGTDYKELNDYLVERTGFVVSDVMEEAA